MAVRKNSVTGTVVLGTRLLKREAEREPEAGGLFGRYAFQADIHILSDGAVDIAGELPSFSAIMDAVGPYLENGNLWLEKAGDRYTTVRDWENVLKKHPEADQRAAVIDHEALMGLLEYYRNKTLKWKRGNVNNVFRAFDVPYIAFADSARIGSILLERKKERQKPQPDLHGEALLLNDTPDAVLDALDQDRLSGYASLRGEDEEKYRLMVCERRRLTPA